MDRITFLFFFFDSPCGGDYSNPISAGVIWSLVFTRQVSKTMNAFSSLLSVTSATSPAVKKLLGWKQVYFLTLFIDFILVLVILDKSVKMQMQELYTYWNRFWFVHEWNIRKTCVVKKSLSKNMLKFQVFFCFHDNFLYILQGSLSLFSCLFYAFFSLKIYIQFNMLQIWSTYFFLPLDIYEKDKPGKWNGFNSHLGRWRGKMGGKSSGCLSQKA